MQTNTLTTAAFHSFSSQVTGSDTIVQAQTKISQQRSHEGEIKKKNHLQATAGSSRAGWGGGRGSAGEAALGEAAGEVESDGARGSAEAGGHGEAAAAEESGCRGVRPTPALVGWPAAALVR